MILGVWLACVMPRPPAEPVPPPSPEACVRACVESRATETAPLEDLRAACAAACEGS